MSEYQLSIEGFIEAIIGIANEELFEGKYENAREIFYMVSVMNLQKY